jgi:recombination protein RecA
MAKKVDETTEKLNSLLSAIEKDCGKEAIMDGIDDNSKIRKMDVIPTRSLSLDRALGVGGYPRGRIIEIFGPEASGKTTLALIAVAECQAQGGICAFIDVEHACDLNYMKALGVNLSKNKLLFSQPDTAQQALNLVMKMAESGIISLIVLDSVASLCPKEELEGEVGDSHIGLVARLMSQVCRKLKGVALKTNTCCIFVNQIREKIGLVGFGGSNEVIPGGRALKFYSSVRIDIRRTGSISGSSKDKDKDDKGPKIGNEVRVKVIKNKVAPPFREAAFQIIFGEGISYLGNLVDLGVQYGIIEKTGSWFAYDGQRLGLGKIPAIDTLKKWEPAKIKEIDTKIREMLFKPIEKDQPVEEENTTEPSQEKEIVGEVVEET